MKKDKNGLSIDQDGVPVRIVQNDSDYKNSNRKFYTKEIEGQLYLTIPLDEFKNEGTSFYNVERF